MTLHRMLEYRPEYIVDCETCKLSGGAFKRVDITSPCVIIVDEASMVDVQLWAALMGAIERGGNVAAVRFVGDADQLPPVGAGQPFADHLRALSDADLGKPTTTVVRLESVFRQGTESWIAKSAPLVLAGKMPDLSPRADFRFVTEVRADHVPGVIEDILLGKHDADVGFTAAKLAADYVPVRGFGTGVPAPVLVPQNKGLAGVSVINRLLSEHYNPHAAAMSEADLVRIPLEDGTDLRVGARVLITKNDYRRNVRNGDTGVIEHMDLEFDRCGKPQPVTLVRLDPDETTTRAIIEAERHGQPRPLTPLVTYTFKQAREELQLGYAMTIHKSQGSQYPWVIVVCHSTHTRMLTRRLLYTALTRASEGVVIVGNRDGIARAVGNANELPRNTQLAERLRRGLVL
jgi:exodeoxyribonuclease V alpha subunit